VQREILQTSSSPNLRVYAVWVPFLGGNQSAADLSRRVLPDQRVIQYWDGGAVTSAWFASNVEHSSAPAWDVFFLYGPEARWAGTPAPLASTGSTILGNSGRLHDAIEPLLQGVASPTP
jgi:hypothetical protein